MNTSEELHVIFGSGPVGRAVMSELLTRGYRVRMVVQHLTVVDNSNCSPNHLTALSTHLMLAS
jgi:hypothetical protein